MLSNDHKLTKLYDIQNLFCFFGLFEAIVKLHSDQILVSNSMDYRTNKYSPITF